MRLVQYKYIMGVNLIFSSCSTLAYSEFGVKGGFNLYDNNLSSPSTAAQGFFMNAPLSERWSLEGGLILLGEVEENNQNKGAFNAVELSGMYHIPTIDEQYAFIKVGVAPWFGYMDTASGEQAYEYGTSPLLGIGYGFHLYQNLWGRFEYQYISNLGGNVIGQADTHLFSIGIAWRSGNANSYSVVSQYQDGSRTSESDFNELASSNSHFREKISHPNDIAVISLESKSHSESSVITPNGQNIERHLYGTWLFDNNSSELVVPKPFRVLDTARHWLSSQACVLRDLDVAGYSDAVGSEAYNLWLSQRRAQKVAAYLKSATNAYDSVAVSWHGNKRLRHQQQEENSYERRVDFQMTFLCVESDNV